MPRFSTRSKKKLKTCHPLLQEIFNEVVKEFDCTPIYGHRGVELQQGLFAIGRTVDIDKPTVTTKDGVNNLSMHNYYPSLAIDIAPHPIDFKDRERITFFAGYVLGIAKSKGIYLLWGGDWNRDFEVKDNRFDDLLHYQLSSDLIKEVQSA